MHPNRLFPTLLLLFASLLHFPAAPAEYPSSPSTLAESRVLFEEAVAELEEPHQEQIDLLLLHYARNLDAPLREARDNGHLDAVLLITEEQRRAREGEPLRVQPDEQAPEGLRNARRRHLGALRERHEEHRQNLSRLRENYLSHLKARQRTLTQEGNIEEALAYREEQHRIETLMASPAPPPEEIDPEADYFSISWRRGLPDDEVIVHRGQDTERHPFQHQGDNRISARGLELRDGISRLPNLREDLLEAARATNELTLVLTLEIDILEQLGPARILSYSQDTTHLNFSVGQQGEQLILRLRTPQTNSQGDPQIPLGSLREGRSTTLVLTYRPGELRVYRDGTIIDTHNRDGDFSNWDPHHLVLGNEHTGDRPWRGRLRAFQIRNHFLPQNEALRISVSR